MSSRTEQRKTSGHRQRRASSIQNILHAHWQEFARESPQPQYVHRAAYLLAHCRTAVLGGHVVCCEHGHVAEVYYNSCRHRCCPACSSVPRANWLARWQAKMLNTPAHHIVFTVPQELVALWRMNKKGFTDALFTAAKDSLLTLLADPQFLGAEPGLLGALHTWSQALAAHPHCHFIVTSGGLASDGSWRTAKKQCLLPRKVLMIMFRGKLLAKLRELVSSSPVRLPENWTEARYLSLLNRLGRATWNVKLLERYAHAEGVAIYLAKYLRGGPISNQRLLRVQAGQVTFGYLDRRDGKVPIQAKCTLPVANFLKLWSQHVPPAGMHTVRAYGLYASGSTKRLNVVRQLLKQTPYDAQQFAADQKSKQVFEALQDANALAAIPSASTCTTCGKKLERCRVRFPAARPWQVMQTARPAELGTISQRPPPEICFVDGTAA